MELKGGFVSAYMTRYELEPSNLLVYNKKKLNWVNQTLFKNNRNITITMSISKAQIYMWIWSLNALYIMYYIFSLGYIYLFSFTN